MLEQHAFPPAAASSSMRQDYGSLSTIDENESKYASAARRSMTSLNDAGYDDDDDDDDTGNIIAAAQLPVTATSQRSNRDYLPSLPYTSGIKVAISVTVMLLLGSMMMMMGNYSDRHHSNQQQQQQQQNEMENRSSASNKYGLANSYPKKPVTIQKYLLEQRVDHFIPHDDSASSHPATSSKTWSHPYFVSEEHFAGPGHPILVIIGGEGPVTDILYPYVSKHMAPEFGAYVLQTEHRFYGQSQPLLMEDDYFGTNVDKHDETKTTTELMMHLFTPEQAIADYIHIIQTVQRDLGCSPLPSSQHYCSIVTIGSSYPGFLSAIMRMRYSNVVDIGYAASAPMRLNAHSEHDPIDMNAYFAKVQSVAEEAYPGCVEGTHRTLEELYHHISSMTTRHHHQTANDDASTATTTTLTETVATELGICIDTLPDYLRDNLQEFALELTQLVVDTNADMNMGYYPPSSDRVLLPKVCQVFSAVDDSSSPSSAVTRYANFLKLLMTTSDYQDATDANDSKDCFDLQTQIPSGPNATISSADWTGTGPGRTGARWAFQVCKDLVIQTGYGNTVDNMFYPPREWTMEWLTQHCASRFGPAMIPQPHRLNNMWHFDDLTGVSKLLFTNGEHDGWSVGSYMKVNDNDDVRVVNFPNGAHHSELSHQWPRDDDTDDILEGREEILNLLHEWLEM